MDIIRKEIVKGYELNLRTHPDGDKWIITRKGNVIGLISLLPTKRYLLELEYSKDGYTLVEDFDSLEDAWNKTKEYIAYFRL